MMDDSVTADVMARVAAAKEATRRRAGYDRIQRTVQTFALAEARAPEGRDRVILAALADLARLVRDEGGFPIDPMTDEEIVPGILLEIAAILGDVAGRIE